MLGIIIALSAAALVFAVAMALMPKDDKRIEARRRERIELLEQQQLLTGVEAKDDYIYTFDDALHDLPPIGQKLMYLPGAALLYRLMVQAGYQQKAGFLAMVLAGIGLVAVVFAVSQFGALGVPVGLVGAYVAAMQFLKGRVDARNRKFIERFADALDMIVRAIRSGNPVNSAFRIVAEHGDSPVAEEFKRLVDEITYGRVMTEALARLAKRVPEQDVSFFVVVLTVQQETGGNLGEILSKLAHIIRKRQELILKVRAITAEGRITSYVLGSLPLFMMGALHLTSPAFIMPLFTTDLGHMFLVGVVALVGVGMFVIRQMVKIEI